MEPREAHRGRPNTAAQGRASAGQDRRTVGQNEDPTPADPIILQGAECRRYYRLPSKGKAFLGRPEPSFADAEVEFQRALTIARERDAKFWELRAATSLARLWSDQQRNEDARNSLAPVYNWFTEGFGTPDLKEAKALLDELTSVGQRA
jgi:hypothetical protein